MGSRIQPLPDPLTSLPLVDKPVMQSTCLTLPELDALRDHSIAAPMRGPGHGTAGKLLLKLVHPLLKRLDREAFRAAPGTPLPFAGHTLHVHVDWRAGEALSR